MSVLRVRLSRDRDRHTSSHSYCLDSTALPYFVVVGGVPRGAITQPQGLGVWL